MCSRCSTLEAQCRRSEEANSQLTDEISGLLTSLRQSRAECTRLKNELRGKQDKTSDIIRDLCIYHDEKYRAAFPRSKGLDYPLDGTNARAFRKALAMMCAVNKKRFTPEDIRLAIDGVFLSDFHTTKSTYCQPPSFLGDENKIRRHMQRAEKRDEYRKDLELLAMEARLPNPNDVKVRALWLLTHCPMCEEKQTECTCGAYKAAA